MWVSRRTDYATRAILALSLEGGGPLKLEELARRTAVPQSVLEQVMPTMRTAGVVRSERGTVGRLPAQQGSRGDHARAHRPTLPGPARADQLRDAAQPRAVPDDGRLHAARRVGGGARRDDHAARRRDVRRPREARRRAVGRSRRWSHPCRTLRRLRRDHEPGALERLAPLVAQQGLDEILGCVLVVAVRDDCDWYSIGGWASSGSSNASTRCATGVTSVA